MNVTAKPLESAEVQCADNKMINENQYLKMFSAVVRTRARFGRTGQEEGVTDMLQYALNGAGIGTTDLSGPL